jgi:hypothetical protein
VSAVSMLYQCGAAADGVELETGLVQWHNDHGDAELAGDHRGS